MNNNDILRRIRYTFNYNDTKMISIFELANLQVTREEISNWMKKDDDPTYIEMEDVKFSTFLNGFIIEKRGAREGQTAEPENKLTNNIIFRKLKIAFNLKADDVLDVMTLADFKVSKHELSSFSRRPDHKNYRKCKDQILRNFLMGLQIKIKGKE